MRSDMLLLIAARFERALFVGDPGQLDPFSIIDTPRWTGLPYDPMLNAVTVLQAHNQDLPVHRLPVSWRLPASAARSYPARFTRFPASVPLPPPTPGIWSSPQPGYATAPTPPWSWPRGQGGHCTNCLPGTRSALTARQPKRPPGRRRVRTPPRRSAAQPA
jgi:hypothetical protein